MKLDPKLLLASMGISAGIVLFVMGMNTGLTGRDATNLPDAIENISPGQGERVLRQSQVIVDFVDGYEATMFIDGIELPTTRLDELISSGAAPAPGAGAVPLVINSSRRVVGSSIPSMNMVAS